MAMDTQSILKNTHAYVKNFFESQEGSHDWHHIERVVATARTLAREENADSFVVEMAALLHDIGDYKLHGGDTTIGSSLAREWMIKQFVGPQQVEHVCSIIDTMSFRDGKKREMPTPEGKVVQDADRLDSIGAIGIARAFAYGGSKGRKLHDPEKQPGKFKTFEERKNANTGTINHFHEKLLLLKERMNTASAKKLAEGRHQYMELFLKQFHSEWTGNR